MRLINVKNKIVGLRPGEKPAKRQKTLAQKAEENEELLVERMENLLSSTPQFKKYASPFSNYKSKKPKTFKI